MKWITKLAYATGQTQKDLVAAVLNIYVIIYFEKCLQIPSAEVGSLLLFGQIVNAISTPLIGYLSDRSVSTNGRIRNRNSKFVQHLTRGTYFEADFRMRSRKSWHFYGSILMTIAFPCIFGQPKHFAWLPMWAKFIINGTLLMLVQVSSFVLMHS